MSDPVSEYDELLLRLANQKSRKLQKAGDADGLIRWYNDGADGAIDWGSPGDFEQCVAVAGDHLDDPEGFCNLRHQDAVGGPPGSEDS